MFRILYRKAITPSSLADQAKEEGLYASVANKDTGNLMY